MPAEPTATEKITDRIAKLLAKAESTTPQEAEALTERATALMVRYGVEQAMLDGRRAAGRSPAEPIVEQHLDFPGAYRLVVSEMAIQLAGAVGLRCLQMVLADRRRVFFVGFDSDVRHALTLVASLQIQGTLAMRAWWLEHPWRSHAGVGGHDKFKEREQFLRSFGAGAAQRVKDLRRDVVQEIGTGAEVAIRDRRSLVDEHIDSAYPDLRTSRRSSRVGGTGYAAAAGAEAAALADVGQRAAEGGDSVQLTG